MNYKTLVKVRQEDKCLLSLEKPVPDEKVGRTGKMANKIKKENSMRRTQR
jgi:hypothetical protein